MLTIAMWVFVNHRSLDSWLGWTDFADCCAFRFHSIPVGFVEQEWKRIFIAIFLGFLFRVVSCRFFFFFLTLGGSSIDTETGGGSQAARRGAEGGGGEGGKFQSFMVFHSRQWGMSSTYYRIKKLSREAGETQDETGGGGGVENRSTPPFRLRRKKREKKNIPTYRYMSTRSQGTTWSSL